MTALTRQLVFGACVPLAFVSAARPAEPVYAFPLKLIAPADDAHTRRSEASAVSLHDGNVLLAWCDLAGAGDNAKGFIAGQKFSPAGDAIGEMHELASTPPNGLNTLSPALRRMKDGRIGMAFSYRMSTKEASRQFIVSADEGRTWSKPVPVSDGSDPYMTGCNDRLTILDSGRLIAPLHCSDDWNKHHLHVRVAHSDDGGRTWKTTTQKLELPYMRWPDNRAGIESGCIEPGVAERADGTLLMTIRTAMGTQFCSESRDHGDTWSPPRTLEVISPQAPANLSRIPGTDKLLLVWTPNYDPNVGGGGRRHTILAAVSSDGGRNWPPSARKVLVDDPLHSTDYPSVLYRDHEIWITLRVSTGAGTLQGRTSTALMRVPLDWLLR